MVDTRPSLKEFDQLATKYAQTGQVSRRELLKFAGAGTSVALLSAILAACGNSSPSSSTASSSSSSSSSSTSSSSSSSSSSTSSSANVATAGAGTPAVGATQSTKAPAISGPVQTTVTLTMPIVTVLDVTLDPQQTQNFLLFFNMFDYIYGGLTKFDKDAHVIHDLATGWDVSQDGLTYTFHLREGIKFASGRPVTTDDFIYSWERALNPKKPAPASFFMQSIKGYDDFTTGKTTTLEGAKKVDDQTLQVILSQPINYFLAYLCTIAWYVVDKDLVSKYGDITNSDWTNHQPYGTGAWKVSDFNPATGVTLVPNENYWGKPSPSVTKLSWPILRGPTAANQALNLYQAHQADIVSAFPLSLLDAVRKSFSDDIVTVIEGETSSIALNYAKKPFDNSLVRIALAMATDRDTYCNTIWRGAYKPTTSFEPPAIPNYTPPEGIAYNPDEAKKVLAAAGFPGGKGLAPVQWYISSDTSGENVNRYRALAQMWNTTLGMNVQVNTALTTDQITNKRTSENGLQIEDFGVVNITDTPQLLSEFLRSDSVYQKGRFNWGIQVPVKTYNGVTYDPTADAKKFDQLMDQADVEQDAAKRSALYKEGEALVLKDAVFVPYGNSVIWELVRPTVQGLEWGAFYYSFPRSIEEKVTVTKG